MKAYIICCFIALGILASCKDEQGTSVGRITGPDYRDCLCCGGYFIEIDKKTYRFYNDELPPGSINFETASIIFPLKVRVKWKMKEDTCMGDEILISKLKTP